MNRKQQLEKWKSDPLRYKKEIDADFYEDIDRREVDKRRFLKYARKDYGNHYSYDRSPWLGPNKPLVIHCNIHNLDFGVRVACDHISRAIPAVCPVCEMEAWQRRNAQAKLEDIVKQIERITNKPLKLDEPIVMRSIDDCLEEQLMASEVRCELAKKESEQTELMLRQQKEEEEEMHRGDVIPPQPAKPVPTCEQELAQLIGTMTDDEIIDLYVKHFKNKKA